MTATDPAPSLNDAQRRAVEHAEGPLLVLAGPGSGKTRVITTRLARLLQAGASPANLLALTFTNKAAEEMRQRLRQVAPRADEVWIGTFHRFAARMLRHYAPLVGLEPNFSICDADDSRGLLSLAIADCDVDMSHLQASQIGAAISWAKARMIGPQEYQPSMDLAAGYVVAAVYPAYQRRLQESNAADFDDLLYYLATLLRDNPELRRQLDQRYRFIMVDEYQDTNHAQYAIARALSIDYPNLVVTGDPDQSIYSWRGANIENILEFERDFPDARIIRLETNYRSSPEILAVADALIAHNVHRKPKQLSPTRPSHQPVRLAAFPSDREEANQVADFIAAEVAAGRRRPGDFAIFYRTNAQSRLFEYSLNAAGVPYHIVHGVEFFQRKEVRDLLAYLQLINNPRNDIALRRVLNTPPRRIGKVALGRLQADAQRRGVSLLEACRHARGVEKLTPAAAKAASGFSQLIDELSVQAHGLVKNLLLELIGRTEFQDYLRRQFEDGDERVANIDELLSDAAEFDARHPEDGSLELYLEQRALVNESDDLDTSGGSVAMMTLHAAKGLEFPAVFIVGVEQGLLPHQRSLQDEMAMEEERRLFFVGLTRAEELLQISFAHYRSRQGSLNAAVPSPFLLELPRDQMQVAGMQPASWSDGWSIGDDDYRQDAPEEDEEERAWSGGGAFDPAEFDQSPRDFRETPPRASGKLQLPGLRTAAEMLRQAESPGEPPAWGGTEPRDEEPPTGLTPREAPELFQAGTLVRHPEYGEGRILAVSGRGPRRVARVLFFDEEDQKKIVLHHSPLLAIEEPPSPRRGGSISSEEDAS